MTTGTMFEGNKDDNPTATTPAKTEDKGLLDALVGEKQKYKNVEELAKAYAHADEFISQLKEENRLLKEKAAAAKTIDDVLARIDTAKTGTTDDNPPTISQETIAQLVEQTLTGRETAKTREANLKKADAMMKEKFGEQAEAKFKERAKTPELMQVYTQLASQDPEQFVAMFGEASVQPTNKVDTSNASTTLTPPSTQRANVEGTKEWAAKMRKDNPSLYWSTEFQAKLATLVAKNPSLYFGT